MSVFISQTVMPQEVKWVGKMCQFGFPTAKNIFCILLCSKHIQTFSVLQFVYSDLSCTTQPHVAYRVCKLC